MKLFDDITRTDRSPAKYSESSYDFLNRSSWSESQRIRDLLETWFSAYPASDKQQLKNTFTNANYPEHLGAWWELYVFTMYEALGYDVAVHPELPDPSNEKRPDFLVSRGQDSFYVECTAVSPQAHSGEQDWSGHPWIYDSINEVNDPNFFIGLRVVKGGTMRPRVRDITGPLRDWLSTLDPDDESDAEIPPLPLVVKDWELSFTAYPIDPEKRDGTGRLLGILPPSGAFIINDVDVLHRALRDKGGRYGELDKPLIVALASVTGFTDEEDVTDAVFGRKAVQYFEGQRDSAKLVRLKNGYWRPGNSGSAPRGARVSGVLFAQQLHPWTVASAFPKLWVNPWARQPLTVTGPFGVISVQDSGEVVDVPGTAIAAALFGVPDSWPN